MGKTYRRGDGHFLNESKPLKPKKDQGPKKKNRSNQTERKEDVMKIVMDYWSSYE